MSFTKDVVILDSFFIIVTVITLTVHKKKINHEKKIVLTINLINTIHMFTKPFRIMEQVAAFCASMKPMIGHHGVDVLS